MKRKSIITVMVVAMLLTVSLYFVSGTYARYTDTLTGSAEAQVAKWAVKVDDQDIGTAEEKTLNLDFTVDSNDYVVEGKIAPATSLSAEVELDLTGTEVAVDILGKVDTKSLADIIGTSQIEAKFTVDGNEIKETADDTPTFAVGAIGSTHTVKVTISWNNASDAQNAADTALGRKESSSLTLPVTLTVQQHIDSSNPLK